MKGKIFDSDSMILLVEVGDAKGEDGSTYELSTTLSNAPIVKSNQTGKYFSLPWSDIITLAIEAGIDEEDKEDE